jgi:hypothetical protein
MVTKAYFIISRLLEKRVGIQRNLYSLRDNGITLALDDKVNSSASKMLRVEIRESAETIPFQEVNAKIIGQSNLKSEKCFG